MVKILTMIVIVATVILTIFIAFPKLLIAQDQYPAGWCEEKDRICLIKRYTSLFHSDPDTVYSVNMCEGGPAGHNGDFHNGAYHSFGWFAYFTETWNRYGKLYRKTFSVDDQFDIHSLHDQIKLTSWVYSLGEVNKREWTTYVALINDGTFSFYSKFHKKNFVVRCPLQKIP